VHNGSGSVRAWSHSARRPLSVGVIAQFALIGLSVSVVVATALAWYLENRATDVILDQLAERATDQIVLALPHHLARADLEPPFTEEGLDTLSARLERHLLPVRQADPRVIRLNVWAGDGTLLYSDAPGRTGQKKPTQSPLFTRALAGEPGKQLSSLESPWNADLRERYDQALEVYVPLRLNGQVVGAFEVYQDLGAIRPMRPLVWGTVAGGLGILLLALFGVALSAARRIGRQQWQAEFLAIASQELNRSLDATTTVKTLADLLVPALADVCAVELVQGDGTLSRVASAHVEAAMDEQLDQVEASTVVLPLVARGNCIGRLTCLRNNRRGLRRSDAWLAKELAGRAALAIDNGLLYQAAQAAIQARDEFLSAASHELKTPTTSLLGYAQFLGRRLDQGEAVEPQWMRRALSTIERESQKLSRLVVQLLDVSRIEAGGLVLDRKPTDVARLAEDVVAAARLRTAEHQFVLDADGPIFAPVDPLRLEQVLTNLVDNAIKFSPDGGRIELALGRAEPGLVRAEVRDRGVGIPAERRAHIFERFYRAHEGDPLVHAAGMGLGLFLSRQIVELHGGRIDVESPTDGGTCFVVTLPGLS
jgi:signal transduction histidine kinase